MAPLVSPLIPVPPPAIESRKGLIPAGTTPLHRLDGDLWVEVIDLATAQSTLASAWDDLAANACDPNVFFERWFLAPAMAAFQRGRQLAIACVHRGSSRKDVAPGLVGLFPFEVGRRRGCLSRTLKLFSNEYTFLMTPLIRQGHAVETWEAFLNWADHRSGCDVVELANIRGDGAVAKALAEVVYRRSAPSLVSSIHTRAVLRRSPSAEECLAAALTTKQRHEYARQTRRLGELGRLEHRRLESSTDAHQWVEWFIELESRGWKGEAGTALAEDRTAREFFTNVMLGAARNERLQALGLWLDDRPIALKLNLLASPGSFAFKIAYDEEFYRFSPGVLLELENIRLFHDHGDAAWMDSCAAPNHPMINRIWRDRILIQQSLLSTGTLRGNLAVGFRPLGRVLKHIFKRTRTPERRGSSPSPQPPHFPTHSIDDARNRTMIALQSPPASPASSSRHLTIDPAAFQAGFNQTPFLIGHSLCQHPLFELERLLDLAKTLPEDCIEYNAGKLPVSISHAETPRNGLSSAETIRRIAECKSWLVLKYVERDPAYRALLDECLAQVAQHSESLYPGMCFGQAFVFITSPGSVTPLHIDPEHNFLLQIRGSKEVHLYDGRDRNLLPEEQLEHFYTDRGRNMTHQPWFEEKSWTFDLQPGQGLHFPVTYPHWVKNGSDVSISFSITFRTPDLDRRRALYSMNARLRQWKLKPKAVGSSRLRDAMLFNAFRVGRKLGLGKK